MEPPRALGLLLVAGAPFAWWVAVKRLRELRRGILLRATVTGHDSRLDRGSVKYRARFSVTVDGKTIEGTSEASGPWKSPAVGAVVPVRYRPREEFPLQDVSAMAYVAPVILVVLGALMAGEGVSIFTDPNVAWW